MSTARDSAQPLQVLTAVRGWPGIGKTTLTTLLAHDPEVTSLFSDGVLWTSLGPAPDVLAELANWGRQLGSDCLLSSQTVQDARTHLKAILADKRMLLIVDDVWTAGHALAFQCGGPTCAMLVTTRLTEVARALTAHSSEVFHLDVLTAESSLALLKVLAPAVVEQYPRESRDLVRCLEGLPLALQVAGRLLNAEATLGWGIGELLREIRDEAFLLKASAPADCADSTSGVTPTVASLLQKSTSRLDPRSRDCFAMLGTFAARPATFDLSAIEAVWETDDPKLIVRNFVDRGLLEPLGDGRFQMHALLLDHARSLLNW